VILERIRISNFRSIGEIDVEISPLTVLVGPNASGKSNILDALQFVKDVYRDGLQSAVDARQGSDYVRCQATRAGGEDLITFDLTFVPHSSHAGRALAPDRRLLYTLHARIPPRGAGVPAIVEELVTVLGRSEADSLEVLRRTEEHLSVLWTGVGLLAAVAGPEEEPRLVEMPTGDADRSAVPPFASGSVFLLVLHACVDDLDSYDIVPNAARAPSPTARGALGSAGGNLASALHQMSTSDPPTGTQAMHEHLAAVVPGFSDLVTDEVSVGTLTFRVVERGLIREMGPNQISDGTVRLLCYHALMASIGPRQRRNARGVCVEEPERGLHPWVIAELMETFREFATSNQVILTTHSPVVVDAAKPEEVVIVEKADGMTTARRASHREDVEIFLKRFSLGELWQQGRVGGVPH